MKKLVSLSSIGFAAALTGCGSYNSAYKVAANAVQNVGCKVSQSEMWNSLHQIVEQNDSFPSASDLRSALMKAGEAKGFRGAAYEKYVDAFVHNYSVTVEGIQNSFAPQDQSTWQKSLAEMEIGIRVTSVHDELQSKITSSLKALAAAEKDVNASCPSDSTPVVDEPGIPPVDNKNFDTVWQQLAASQNPEIVGLKRTLANAYQSCDVLSLPAMTASTPIVSGIKDMGANTRPGGGHIRKIDNLANVISTDYYIKNMNPAKSTCFDVRKDPPIYNFGAKPYYTSSKPLLLDMFTHVKSGGPTLGIDCSGFVFTALGIMGLKMDPDPAKPLKANLVGGIPSGAFKEPQSNGLRCLAKITVSATNSLKAGDIVAINGHVFLINSTGADPFGLARAASAADCTSSKLTSKGFDFVIAQSSPVKNGIGIDLMQARDYLDSSTTIRSGLVAYAVASCRAKFGAAANLSSPNLSVVRHKRTSECKAPALQLTHDDCVQSCRPL